MAVPKTYRTSEGLLAWPGPDEATLMVECEITQPPSSAGRSVYLYLSAEMVTKMLLELRKAGIRARRKPMEP